MQCEYIYPYESGQELGYHKINLLAWVYYSYKRQTIFLAIYEEALILYSVPNYYCKFNYWYMEIRLVKSSHYSHESWVLRSHEI